jgi:hypothetical protein
VADNLTDNAESRALNWLTGNTTTAPTLPLKARLMTVLGSDSAAGTEVVGGSYAAPSIAFGSSSSGAPATNSADVDATGMPNTGAAPVIGLEIWDSAGTPFRWWHGPLSGGSYSFVASTDIFTSASHGLSAGDRVAFASGQAPTGFTAGTSYYVIATNLATNTFMLSATLGGSSVNGTVDLSGTYIRARETGSGDTLRLAAGTVSLALG